MKPPKHSPFNLENTDAYLAWREPKLTKAISKQNKPIIPLKMTPPHFYEVFAETDIKPHKATIETLLKECHQNNYCLYSIEQHQKYNQSQTKQMIHALVRACGLTRLNHNLCADEDSLTAISQSEHQGQHSYIPYSDKALNWHTDGYYNLPKDTIYTMLLHCFNSAKEGGESAFLDHEIAYILMRDENPKWIKALSQDNVMTIPANELNGKVIRQTQTGPVFSLTPQGRLHMRYSARKKNIFWKNDSATNDALTFLDELFTQGSKYIVTHKLKAGEGVISRNILHCRTAFTDDTLQEKQRLLYRGRFNDELPTHTF